MKRFSDSSQKKFDSGRLPKLHKAAFTKNIARLRRLLSQPSISVNQQDFSGRTVLHHGCMSGSSEVVSEILHRANPINIEARDNKGRTPIFMAVESNNMDSVELISSQKAEVNIKDTNGTPLLHHAVRRNNTNIVRHLIMNCAADVEITDKNGFSVLHVSAALGLVSMTKTLTSQNAPIDSVDWKKRTPLMAAVAGGFEEIVEVLLGCDASLSLADQDGMRTADWAKKRRNKRIQEMIQEAEIRRKFTNIFHSVGENTASCTEEDPRSSERHTGAVVRNGQLELTTNSFSKAVNSVFNSESQVYTQRKSTEDYDTSIFDDLQLKTKYQQNNEGSMSDMQNRQQLMGISYTPEIGNAPDMGNSPEMIYPPEMRNPPAVSNPPELKNKYIRNAQACSLSEMRNSHEFTHLPEAIYPPELNNPPDMTANAPDVNNPPEITMTIYPENEDENTFEHPVTLAEDLLKSDSEEYIVNEGGYLPNLSMELLLPAECTEPGTQTQTTSMDHLWISDSEGNESNYEMKPSFKNIAMSTQSSSGSEFDNEFVVASNINLEISRDGEASSFFMDTSEVLDPENMTREEFKEYSKAKIQRLKEKNRKLVAEVTHSVQDAFIMQCKRDDTEARLTVTASNMELQRARGDELVSRNAELEKKVKDLSRIIDDKSAELERERESGRKKDGKIQLLTTKLEALTNNGEFGADADGDGLRKKIEWLSRMKIQLEMELDEEVEKLRHDCKCLEGELVVKQNEVETERAKAEKQEKILVASRQYYEEKLTKLNNERVKQQKKIAQMRDGFLGLSQEMERLKAEKIEGSRKESGSSGKVGDRKKASSNEEGEVKKTVCEGDVKGEGAKEPTGLKHDDVQSKPAATERAENITKDAKDKQDLLNELSNRREKIKAQEIEMEVLKSQMMILEIRLKENEGKQSVMSKQIHHRKLGEELKQRFLTKGEELEKELIKLRIDLNYEKEKKRRLLLSDEIKTRFVDSCENLQIELAEMKAAQESWMEEKCKMIEEVEARDMKLKEYEDLKSKAQDQEQIVQVLRDGISDARQQLSKYMKAYASVKNKAEMYDDLVGSNLQLEEEISNLTYSLQELSAVKKDDETEAVSCQATIIKILNEAKKFKAQLEVIIDNGDLFVVDGGERGEKSKVLLEKNAELAGRLSNAREELGTILDDCRLLLDGKHKEDVLDDDTNIVRDLWKARMQIEKMTTEVNVFKDERRNLLAKVEAYKEFAAKHCQNSDDMISLEEVLEENATLMEENATMVEKYSAKLKEIGVLENEVRRFSEFEGSGIQASLLGSSDKVQKVDSNASEKPAALKSGELETKEKHTEKDSIYQRGYFEGFSGMAKNGPQAQVIVLAQSSQRQHKEMQTQQLQQHEKEMQTQALQQHEKEMQTQKLQQHEKEMQTQALQQHEKEMQTQNVDGMAKKYEYLKEKTAKWTKDLADQIKRLQDEIEKTGKQKLTLQEKYEQMKRKVKESEENYDELQKKYECLLDCLKSFENKKKTQDVVNVAENFDKHLKQTTTILGRQTSKYEPQLGRRQQETDQEMTNIQTELKETTKLLDTKQQECLRLNGELNMAELRLEGLYSENNEMRMRLEDAVLTAERLKIEKAQYYDDLIRVNEELQVARNETLECAEDAKHSEERCAILSQDKIRLSGDVGNLNEIISGLKRDYAILEKDYRKVKNDADAKEETNLNMLSEIQGLCELLEADRDQHSGMSKANEKLQNNFEKLLSKKSSLDIDCEQLKRELKEAKDGLRRVSELENELVEMKEISEDLLKGRNALLQKYELVKTEVDNYKNSELKLQEEVEDAWKRVDKCNEKIALKDKELERERNKSNTLLEEKLVAEASLFESNRKLMRFSRNYVDMKQRYLTSKSEGESLKEANSELGIKCDVLKTDKQNGLNENAKLCQQKVSVEAEIEKMTEENRSLKQAISEIEPKRKSAIAKIEELNKELTDSKKSIQVLEKRVAQLEAAKVSEEEKFMKLQHHFKVEKHNIEAEFTQKSLENEHLQKEIKDLSKVMKRKEEGYSALISKISKLKAGNEELKKQLAQSKIVAQKSQSQLRDLQLRSSFGTDKVQTLSARLKNLQAENFQLNEKVMICLRENDHISRSLNFTEYRLDISQTRNNELWTQYRESRKEFKSLEWTQTKKEMLRLTSEEERKNLSTLEESIHGKTEQANEKRGTYFSRPRRSPATNNYHLHTTNYYTLTNRPK